MKESTIIRIIGVVISIIINVGAIFWWGGRTSIQIETVIKNQEELTKEFRSWRVQAEGRIGRNYVEIARMKDKLGVQ